MVQCQEADGKGLKGWNMVMQ